MYTFPPGTIMSGMPHGSLPEGDDSYVNGLSFADPTYGSMSGMVNGPMSVNATIDPSLTSSNNYGGPPPLGSSTSGLGAPSATAPNVSPPIASKSPSKKGTGSNAPGSPVKSTTTDGAGDVKEKGSSKRKNMVEAPEPPTKRARRKASTSRG